jgi:adenine-specific DNA-methyltransferase
MPTLKWISKEKVISHHFDVPFRTLVPSYSFGDEKAAKDNLIIHGDNLEALKALLPQYEDKVKLM